MKTKGGCVSSVVEPDPLFVALSRRRMTGSQCDLGAWEPGAAPVLCPGEVTPTTPGKLYRGQPPQWRGKEGPFRLLKCTSHLLAGGHGSVVEDEEEEK